MKVVLRRNLRTIKTLQNMAYFDDDDLYGSDLDLYLVDKDGHIGRFATLGDTAVPTLLTQTVYTILVYWFFNLAKKRGEYKELIRVLVEGIDESTKKEYYRDAEKGLYYFDRGDVEEESSAYRLTLVPENPLHIDEIPDPVRRLLLEFQLPVSFKDVTEIPDALIVPERKRVVPELTEEEKIKDQKLTDQLWREMISSLSLDFSFDPGNQTYRLPGRGPLFCPNCLNNRGYLIQAKISSLYSGRILFYHFPLFLFFQGKRPLANWSKYMVQCPRCDFHTEYAEKLQVHWKNRSINLPLFLARIFGIKRSSQK